MVKYKLYFASLKNRPREVAQKATSDTANISSDEMFGLGPGFKSTDGSTIPQWHRDQVMLRGCLKSRIWQLKLVRVGNDERYDTDLTEEAWALIAPILPAQRPRGRPRTTDLRAVVNAIFYLLRTGCQ